MIGALEFDVDVTVDDSESDDGRGLLLLLLEPGLLEDVRDPLDIPILD